MNRGWFVDALDDSGGPVTTDCPKTNRGIAAIRNALRYWWAVQEYRGKGPILMVLTFKDDEACKYFLQKSQKSNTEIRIGENVYADTILPNDINPDPNNYFVSLIQVNSPPEIAVTVAPFNLVEFFGNNQNYRLLKNMMDDNGAHPTLHRVNF